MAGGAPGSGSRGRGGKFKKYTRGGGHHFSRNLQPIDADGNAVSMWGAEDPTKNGEDSSEEEDDDEEEDSDDEDGTSAAKEEASREARKAQKKARKEAAIAKAKGKTVEVGDMPTSDEEEDEDDEDDDMPANPNHSKAARKQAKAPTAADEDADVDEVTDGVKKLQAGNRKEREALEAAAAKERYLKMQAQGKTDEAKADLARLKVIREQRAAEAARRQAEKEEREAQEKEKRAQIEAREAKKREAAAGPKKSSKKK